MTFVLHGRAFHRTVRTKDAAVARLRTQQRFALGALVEELTGVGRHRFTFSEAASGAHELGFKKNFAHTQLIYAQRKDSRRPQWLWLALKYWLYQDQTKEWRSFYRNPLSRLLRQALSRALS